MENVVGIREINCLFFSFQTAMRLSLYLYFQFFRILTRESQLFLDPFQKFFQS